MLAPPVASRGTLVTIQHPKCRQVTTGPLGFWSVRAPWSRPGSSGRCLRSRTSEQTAPTYDAARDSCVLQRMRLLGLGLQHRVDARTVTRPDASPVTTSAPTNAPAPQTNEAPLLRWPSRQWRSDSSVETTRLCQEEALPIEPVSVIPAGRGPGTPGPQDSALRRLPRWCYDSASIAHWLVLAGMGRGDARCDRGRDPRGGDL